MEIHLTPKYDRGVSFNGNWLRTLSKSLSKKLDAEPILTEKNRICLDKIEDIASKKYDRMTREPVILSVKNGDKEFTFKYNNSVWHRIHISKKGQELCDFEVLHVKQDKEYAFYSTGGYPCKITDERFIKKYNGLLEDWLPRLEKRIEKLDKKQKISSEHN